MERQKINVSSDPPEYVRRVAALVDRRLNEMELAAGISQQQAMALTCFNLADELLKARDENTELKRRMLETRAEEKEKP